MSPGSVWGEDIPGRRDSQCKGLAPGLHSLPGLEVPHRQPLCPAHLGVPEAQFRMNAQNMNGGPLASFSHNSFFSSRLALGCGAGKDTSGEKQGAGGVSTADVRYQRGASAGDRGEGPQALHTLPHPSRAPGPTNSLVQFTTWTSIPGSPIAPLSLPLSLLQINSPKQTCS